jgi:hypothetical protein
MTNPLAILTLHAVNYAITNNKTFVYALGTTILVGILYRHTQHYNFLSPFKYLYSKLKSSNKKVTQSQEILFEDKYFKEYDEWLEAQENENENENENEKKECLENMYYTTVRDTINEFYGDVIMCYDHATFSFAYYARTANIPYKYLETISRKYMIETNAPREIHVDIRKEYKKSKDKTNMPHKTSTASASASASTTDDPSQGGGCGDSPFVKLKSYNTASNLNLHTTTNETKERTHKFASADNKIEKQETSSFIIRENANRYSYRGKLSDYEEHHNTFLAERRRTDTAATTTATATAPATDTDTTADTTADPTADTTADTTADNTTSSYADFKNRKLRSAL